MALILSTPTIITVRAPGTSALSVAAASMAPGTWLQFTVSNQNALLGAGNVNGTMLPYCNAMPWNPVAKRIEILAQDHMYGGMRYVQYDELSHQFVLISDHVPGIVDGHGFDHTTVNPNNGDVYHRVYSGFSGRLAFKRKRHGTSTFVDLPSVSATDQVAIGVCWWSGALAGGGSQGSMVVFNSGNASSNANDGHIVAYNPLTNAWFLNKTGMSPFYGSGTTYGSVMEYSAKKNCAVYGGGNSAPTKAWRLNADGSFTPMPDVPSGKALGIQRGTFIDDPVTGNFLLLSYNQLWELDPSGSGRWTQLTGSRTPPSGVGTPNAPALDGLIATSIPEYGVVAFIKQTNQGGGTFFLYKHA